MKRETVYMVYQMVCSTVIKLNIERSFDVEWPMDGIDYNNNGRAFTIYQSPNANSTLNIILRKCCVLSIGHTMPV